MVTTPNLSNKSSRMSFKASSKPLISFIRRSQIRRLRFLLVINFKCDGEDEIKLWIVSITEQARSTGLDKLSLYTDVSAVLTNTATSRRVDFKSSISRMRSSIAWGAFQHCFIWRSPCVQVSAAVTIPSMLAQTDNGSIAHRCRYYQREIQSP